MPLNQAGQVADTCHSAPDAAKTVFKPLADVVPRCITRAESWNLGGRPLDVSGYMVILYVAAFCGELGLLEYFLIQSLCSTHTAILLIRL